MGHLTRSLCEMLQTVEGGFWSYEGTDVDLIAGDEPT